MAASRKKAPSAFMNPVEPSKELAEIVGKEAMQRSATTDLLTPQAPSAFFFQRFKMHRS